MAFQKGNKVRVGLEPWSKGLTKDTDDRLKSLADNISKTRKRLFAEGKITIWNKIFDENNIEEVKKLYQEGVSLEDISKKFYCDKSVIYKIVKPLKDTKRNLAVKEFKNNLNNLSEYERGYIVGLLDGEGCICIRKVTTTKNPKKIGYVGYATTVNISNQEKDILNFIHRKLGLWTSIKTSKRDKEVYRLNIYGKDIISEFSRFAYPYSHSRKIKKKIEVMLNFCNAKNRGEQDKFYREFKLINSNDLNKL